MSNALITGVSGLLAHKQMLDTTGNNIANANTPGFKSRSVVFADLVYNTLRPPSASLEGSTGGTNGVQLGSGVRLAQTSVSFAQGVLEPTGEPFDFAIQGDGFFVVDNGTESFYSRVGSFALDSTGTLVDAGTGLRVQRHGTVGEPTAEAAGFQVPGDAAIRIPLGASIPGQPTSSIEIAGNLPSSSAPPQVAELVSGSPLSAAGLPATAATFINSLDANTVPYAGGDVIQISGVDGDGTEYSVNISVDGSTTVGDLVTELNLTLQAATASLTANGSLQIIADQEHDSSLAMILKDSAANTGQSSLDSIAGISIHDGSTGAKVRTVVEVFDGRGESRAINLTFRKVDQNSWDVTAEMESSMGTIVDNSVQSIRINDDGSLQQVLGTGTGDSAMTFLFDGALAEQTVDFSFGETNSFEGLTELAAGESLVSGQNGFPPGVLSAINVSSDGIIEGVATNGRKLSVAQLSLASFRNPHGLTNVGDNFYQRSVNSGDAQFGSPQSGDRGAIVGSSLEGSNVDIAAEFTRLIIAQQGFAANARTISVASDVLDELNRLI